MKHVARKRFGQHFLTDRGVVARIVDAVAPRAGERIVEIGPGRGALTDALVAAGAAVVAIEIDRDLARALRGRHPGRLEVIEGDALAFDFGTLAGEGGLRIVGNLPYNISSPLLVRLLRWRAQVRDQHFMLQKEVVDRIAAHAGTAQYGRLSVLMQAFYDIDPLFAVAPEAFEPPPRVDSAVFRMLPRADPGVSPQALEALLAAGFAQRRKMLRGTLIPWLVAHGIDDPGIEPTARAETLDLPTWIALARRLERR